MRKALNDTPLNEQSKILLQNYSEHKSNRRQAKRFQQTNYFVLESINHL